MKRLETTGSRGWQPEGRASGVRRLRVPLPAVFLLTALAVGSVTGQVTKETADVVGQGPGGPVVAMDGATLYRSDTGLTVRLRMPTPVPGTYNYPGPSAFQPEGAFPGHPEAYSLWVIVFNFPEECEEPVMIGDVELRCSVADFFAGRGAGGAFNAGGHVVGGPNLQLSGRVTINSTPFGGSPLLEPRTAEVHVAVAPHGALQPDVMPHQITTPIGTSAHWWLAFFLVE
jgi:hypothetical protein